MRVLRSGRFSRQVGLTFVAQGTITLFALGNAAIVARWLGPGGKGTLALALLLPSMLGLFLGGGIGVANVYFAGSGRLDLPRLTANSTAFALMGTALGSLIVGVAMATGLLGKLVPGVAAWTILLAMGLLPIALLNGYYSSLLQGLQRFASANAVNLVQGGLTLAFTALLVIGLGWGLGGAIVAVLCAGLSALAITVALLHRLGGRFRPRWNRPVMRATLSFGLRGFVGNVLQFFNYRLDVFIVNYFLGPAGVGIYGSSVALAELLWYLPNAVGFVIFPKSAATRPEEMNRFTPRVFAITLGLTAGGAVVLALAGSYLIQLIYGPAFASAYGPLLALLPGVVLLGAAKVLTNEIAGRGYILYNSINSGLGLILTVALDLALIPRYGVLGAAIASSAAYTVIFFTAIGFYLSVSRRTQQRADSMLSS
jgi:O-antigen/teichoic acid export membrane protein